MVLVDVDVVINMDDNNSKEAIEVLVSRSHAAVTDFLWCLSNASSTLCRHLWTDVVGGVRLFKST